MQHQGLPEIPVLDGFSTFAANEFLTQLCSHDVFGQNKKKANKKTLGIVKNTFRCFGRI